jgi:hypothetical protein
MATRSNLELKVHCRSGDPTLFGDWIVRDEFSSLILPDRRRGSADVRGKPLRLGFALKQGEKLRA